VVLGLHRQIRKMPQRVAHLLELGAGLDAREQLLADRADQTNKTVRDEPFQLAAQLARRHVRAAKRRRPHRRVGQHLHRFARSAL
jgi:hypothetical protein